MTRIQTESSAAPGKSAVQQWVPHFCCNNPDTHYISKTIIHDFWLKIFNDIICLPIISNELPYILYPRPTNIVVPPATQWLSQVGFTGLFSAVLSQRK